MSSILEAGTSFGRRWFNNPLAFFVEVLGLDAWSRMNELTCSVRDHNRVAVRAGQKVSKTTAFSGVALWWWATRTRARFIATSASGRQVKTTIWPEVKRLYLLAKERGFDLGGHFHDSPEGGLKSHDGREILGFSSDDPDKFLGLSSPNLYLGIDECSGVLLEIAKAIQGNLSGGGRMLISGNPTQNTGYFYDAFHTKRRYWHCLHIPSTDSPNVTGELGPGRVIPGVAVPEFIEEMREEYGEDSPFFKIKILGQFAAEEENAFIKLALVEAAKQRWEKKPPNDPLWLGVDPARFGGDPSVAYASRGLWLSKGREWRKQDNVYVAEKVAEFADELREPNEIVNVNVDQSNNNGVADILRRIDWMRVHDVLAQESSPDPKYDRRRDHVWASGREWLRVGAIPDEARLHADLLTPRYDWNATGRVKIESKRELRQRLGNRSTDHGDAALLAVYRYVEGNQRNHDELVLSDEFDNMPKAAM